MYLVMSQVVCQILFFEMGFFLCEVQVLVDVMYDVCDIVVSIFFGFFQMLGMVILFCLIKIFFGIVYSYIDGLLICVVDVVLKECCLLVFCVCEILLYLGYLCLMIQVVEIGVVIMFFVLVFYYCLQFFDDVINQMVNCVFDQFVIIFFEDFFVCWQGV